MTHRSLMFVVLAMVVLGGCTTMTQLRVNPEPGPDGNPVIDPTYHHTAFVKPGDRIVWTCQCPPRTEFTVADLRFVADLNKIFEAFLPLPDGIRAPAKLDRYIWELESVGKTLSASAEAPERSGEVLRQPNTDQPAITDPLELLIKLKTALSSKEQRGLFRRGWEPPGKEFVNGTKRIQSQRRVAKGIRNGL